MREENRAASQQCLCTGRAARRGRGSGGSVAVRCAGRGGPVVGTTRPRNAAARTRRGGGGHPRSGGARRPRRQESPITKRSAIATGRAGAPMERDSIFRIYSMTKPVFSVAAMALVEEGVLHPPQPILAASSRIRRHDDRRSAARRKRLRQCAGGARAITLQDLLRHSSGLTYAFIGAGPVKDAYKAAGLGLVFPRHDGRRIFPPPGPPAAFVAAGNDLGLRTFDRRPLAR